MKARIHYIEGHVGSTEQANTALESFQKYGWDAQLIEGVTPKTIDPEEPYLNDDLKGGRLESFRTSEPPKYLIKKSCFINHVRHWRTVLTTGIPMAFIEHDAICTGPPPSVSNQQYIFLAFDTALKQKVFSHRADCKNFKPPRPATINHIQPFPDNYPLKYYKDNVYKGERMTPGTIAYIVTPVGAMRLLNAVQRYGIEQSDFHINSKTVSLSYMTPSPVKYNKNLNTSHNL